MGYMATPLNAYATKVFAEHPLALWALDEQLDYISLFPSASQDLSTWVNLGVDSVVDATDQNVFEIPPPTAPLLDVPVNGIIASVDNGGFVSMVSPFTLQPTDFSDKIKTFSFGLYCYTYSKLLNVKVGYTYTDLGTGQSVPPILKPAAIGSSLAWSFVSETFTVPSNFEDLKLVIEIEYNFTADNDEFVLVGLTAGQWAEEFQLKSYGIAIDDLPTGLNLPAQKAVEAFSYGFDSVPGYYIVDNNYLYSRNNGTPIVYGSSNSTKLTPIANCPSLVVPGMGFLNESGRYNSLTAEFWVNIENNSSEPRRIFGPISSTDGLYADGPYIKIKVDGNTAAHYVGTWNRPMLISFIYSAKRMALILNGEVVVDQQINASTISLPERIDQGNEQDWLGFYAYDDVPSILIDSVAIYPYEVPAIVAKRRWVYGQGVEYPANLKGINSANSVVADFSVAKYARNYYFPSSAGWESGIVENLVIDRDNLVSPSHPLPLFNFSAKSESEWFSELEDAQDILTDPYISLRPNTDWSNVEGHMYYDNINFLQEDTKAFYGIFETSFDSMLRETLFELTSTITSNKISVYLENNVISYVLSIKQSDGTFSEEVLYSALGQRVGDRFLVGLDLEKFVRYYGNKVASFFGSKRKISMFVGGSSNLSNTFNGKIRRISFCNARNLVKIQHFFSERGVPVDYENVFDLFTGGVYDAGDEYFGNDSNYWSLILDGGDPYDFVTISTEEHTATYNLVPKFELGNFVLDIATSSYWENYVPLSYFAKDVPDAYGQPRQKLDFLQFNFDFLRANSFDGDYFNTNGSVVKAYVSFQPISSGANALPGSLSTVKLHKNNSVIPGSEWVNSKYEVLEGTVIYPPSGTNFNQLSINVHLEIVVDGVNSNPFRLKSLQLSSQAFGAFSNKIGSRFGADIIPFTKKGNYFEYQTAPAFSIYKGSTPYMYLTDNSGFKISGNYESSPIKGISMPINKDAADFYKLSNIQMCLRYDEELMPEVPVKLFELKSAFQTTSFYLISDSVDRTRGQIYALNDDTKRLQNNLVFFVNGKPTKRGIIYPKTWSYLSLSFPNRLSFEGTVGALRFMSPIMFNNVSIYETTIADDEERFGFRQWFSVRNSGGQDFDWGYWAGKELVGNEVVVIPDAGFTWQEVLFLAASQVQEVDAEVIYNVFTGTSRIIAGDDQVLTIRDYQYNAYNELAWSQNTVSAV